MHASKNTYHCGLNRDIKDIKRNNMVAYILKVLSEFLLYFQNEIFYSSMTPYIQNVFKKLKKDL